MNTNKTIVNSAELIFKNNQVGNIYEACTCCYDNTKEIDYFAKKEYIRKRVNAGHESVLEHGRMAFKLKLNDAAAVDIAEFSTIDATKYLQISSILKEDATYVLIINGNVRSYKYFLNHISTYDYEINIIIRTLAILIQQNTVAELFDIDKCDIFSKSAGMEPTFVDIETLLFSNLEEEYNKQIEPCTGLQYAIVHHTSKLNTNRNDDDKKAKSIDFGIDTTYINRLKDDPDISDELFLDIICCTVVFRNISRTATHQLVRHRNAITQESQRYVNYSDATFTIPVEDYHDTKTYNIKLGDKTYDYSLAGLAHELIGVYKQLVDQGLKKEEARAFLPSNVDCKRLYMTFSLHNLLAFIKLRTDPHAQYEIRSYAKKVEEIISILLKASDIDIENLKLID